METKRQAETDREIKKQRERQRETDRDRQKETERGNLQKSINVKGAGS